jgi:hypothetical protein
MPKMTIQTLEFHPAPATPAPAPSQIRFPRLPRKNRRPDLPSSGIHKAEMVFLQAGIRLEEQHIVAQPRQESPAYYH